MSSPALTMSIEQTILCYIERAFPLIFLGGVAYLIARKLHLPRVAHAIARLGLGLLLLVVVVAVVGELHRVPFDTDAFFAGWVALGLPVYLVKRWRDGADAREAEAEQLRRARGEERRRAPPPLPPGQHPGGSP